MTTACFLQRSRMTAFRLAQISVAMLTAAAALLIHAPLSAQEAKVGSLTILQAYAAPTRPGQPNGAAFLQVVNTGKAADRLLGFSVAPQIAERGELHTMKHDNGMMMMREVSSFELPAGGKLELAPGKDHLMLIGIKQPLEAGQDIAVTLRFEKAGEAKIMLKVRMPDSHSRHRH